MYSPQEQHVFTAVFTANTLHTAQMTAQAAESKPVRSLIVVKQLFYCNVCCFYSLYCHSTRIRCSLSKSPVQLTLILLE